MTGDVIVRYVEVRSWPERTDVVVIEPARAIAMAHYRLDEQPLGTAYSPIFDPRAPWATRADAAMRSLEENQAFLGAVFETDDEAFIRLEPSEQPRADLERILTAYGLSLADVDVPNLACALRLVARMPVEQLWELIADWYDRVERRYPPGTARASTESWIHRAHPDVASHFTHLAGGDRGAALEIFREEVDVPMGEFGLYPALAWIYFFRTEFAGEQPFRLRALDELLGVTARGGQAPPTPVSPPA